ncbi:MAG: glycosyltransferase family 2 protein [Anaerolineaceae bacterium]|nr:glycosyltransferase family 2 protein [Anaerolineaceae bacterium]
MNKTIDSHVGMNKSDIKVSVIIPAYQSELTLNKAVESVLTQDYNYYEVIIVDNGSTDGTASVIDEMKKRDHRVRSLHLQVNQMPAGGRNAGVHDARGEYIAFLDADDEWLPGKLAYQVALLDEFPDYDLVFSDSWIVNSIDHNQFLHMKGNAEILSHLELKPISDLENTYLVSGPVTRMIYTKSFINMSTSLLRKDNFLRVGGFDIDRFGTEDIDFWVRYSRISKFIFWDQPTANCSQGGGTSKPGEKWLRELIRYHRKSLSSPDYFDLTDIAKLNLEKFYRYLIVIYGLDRKPRKALQIYHESMDLGVNSRLALYAYITFLGAWPFKIGQWFSAKRKKNGDKIIMNKLRGENK